MKIETCTILLFPRTEKCHLNTLSDVAEGVIPPTVQRCVHCSLSCVKILIVAACQRGCISLLAKNMKQQLKTIILPHGSSTLHNTLAPIDAYAH